MTLTRGSMASIATTMVATIGLSACGSGSSSSGGSAGTSGRGPGTVNGAGSTFAAPIYQQGAGKDGKWPTGTGAAKNAGVAAAVKQTPGAVGYVEQAYAIENSFTYAAVKNSAGTFVAPTIPNTSAAAVGVKVPGDLGISTIN